MVGETPSAPTEAGPAPAGRLLEVRDLTVRFGPKVVVEQASFDVTAGRTLAIVGESGSGKSVCSMALMRLLDWEGGTVEGTVKLTTKKGDVIDLYGMRRNDVRKYLGAEISIIFQEPLTALNPVLRVGDQIEEALRLHRGVKGKAARREVVELMQRVWIPDAARRSRAYPHELSGGMRQRVMIAMATVSRPQVLIADEPTTALDVTVQAQILALLLELQESYGMGMVFISHDMAVVAEVADDVLVMRKGHVVESGAVGDVLLRPQHEYTKELISLVPKLRSTRHARCPVEQP